MQPDGRPTDASRAIDPHRDGGAASARRSRMDPERERALVERAGRDAAAFGELYDWYLPRLYGFVFRRVRDRSVAEDLTATTFERGLAALRGGRFRNDAFGGWLYRVAANAVIDHVRAGRRVVSAEDADEHDPAVDLLTATVERDEIRRALERVSVSHRRVLALRFFDDLDPVEASAVLGCSRRTFAVKLHRALGALRTAMSAEPADRWEATDVA